MLSHNPDRPYTVTKAKPTLSCRISLKILIEFGKVCCRNCLCSRSIRPSYPGCHVYSARGLSPSRPVEFCIARPRKCRCSTIFCFTPTPNPLYCLADDTTLHFYLPYPTTGQVITNSDHDRSVLNFFRSWTNFCWELK